MKKWDRMAKEEGELKILRMIEEIKEEEEIVEIGE